MIKDTTLHMNAVSVGSVASKRNFLTTPKVWPNTGFWTNTITWSYPDGAVQSETTRSRCLHR